MNERSIDFYLANRITRNSALATTAWISPNCSELATSFFVADISTYPVNTTTAYITACITAALTAPKNAEITIWSTSHLNLKWRSFKRLLTNRKKQKINQGALWSILEKIVEQNDLNLTFGFIRNKKHSWIKKSCRNSHDQL